MRNNTDQIPNEEILFLDQRGQDWPLVLNWTRKDKLREAVVENNTLKVFFENVKWPTQSDGVFASLWAFTKQGDGWGGYFVWHLRRSEIVHERDAIVNGQPAPEYSVSLPAELIGVEPGEEFGLVFGAPTTRSAIRLYTMGEFDVDEPDEPNEPNEPDGEPDEEPGDGIGEPWPCFEDGRAPVLAMAPTGEQSNEIWGDWLDNIHPELIEMKVDGFHVPMTGDWRPHFYGLLMQRNAVKRKVTAWWLDKERGDGPAFATEQLKRLIKLYDSLENPGWQIVGPTWDVWQSPGWESVDTVNEWIEEAQELVGDRLFMIGARARRSPETGAIEQEYIGDYRAYETHVDTGEEADAVFAQAARDAGGFPVAEFDRFRVRGNPIGEGKDSTLEDIVKICLASRERVVSVIIGFRDARGNVSDVGSGVFPNANVIREILHVKDVDEDDPVIEKPPLEVPNTWGLVAVLDQQHKVQMVREHTPVFNWLRTQCAPAATVWNVDLAINHWIGNAKRNGFNVAVGVYDGPQDLSKGVTAWQEYVLQLAERLIELEQPSIFVADIETANQKFMPEGIEQYFDLWHRGVGLVTKLQDMRHYVIGPGMVHGNTEDFERILSEIRFDAPSAHFYPDQGDEKHLGWMNDAEEIARSAGYNWGVCGESGATGRPSGWWKCRWNGDEQQIRRVRKLLADFAERPYWRLKFYYQILDDPRIDTKYPGYGLFKANYEEQENGEKVEVWVPKPVAKVFR